MSASNFIDLAEKDNVALNVGLVILAVFFAGNARFRMSNIRSPPMLHFRDDRSIANLVDMSRN